jgi:D-alanine transaminase
MPAALPIACLNGIFMPIDEARISPLDRGFLFADAVYEVIAVYGGEPVLLDAHLQRLERSLHELRIANPQPAGGWQAIVEELVTRNGGGDMGVYIQVSRGTSNGRDYAFPPDLPPTVFAMASPLARPGFATSGVRAITGPDIRWGRCDIKATALLANVLLRQAATEAGAGEMILLRDGFVTEGAGSSVIVIEQRTLCSRPDGNDILPGTTIRLVRELAAGLGFGYREEPVSESRLRGADEIWLTAALRGVAPVTHLDGRPVGTGSPGPVWQAVAGAYELQKKT